RQIPVWYCDQGHVTVAESDPTACSSCGATGLTQDPDVLDTWFSSALWTYATLGWPDETPELARFHPTQVLSTARDILYLWVARMIFTSLAFRGEIPFSQVIIHATILDPEGRRMSKSKGTGVDPLLVMDKYGTDATRFWLAGAGTSSQDVRYREEKIETYRNFANKLWNATRFVLMKAAGPGNPAPAWSGEAATRQPLASAVDRWIISRLHRLIGEVTRAVDGFAFSEATAALYEFTWNELCDWYLELAKPRLEAGDGDVRRVLAEVMDTLVRLLHPFMPFITEEINELLVTRGWAPAAETLQRRAWPAADAASLDPAAEREMGLLIETVKTLRNVRAELRVDPAKVAPEIVIVATAADEALLARMAPLVARLGRADRVIIAPAGSAGPEGRCATGLAGENQIFLPLSGFGDVLAREVGRLGKEITSLEGEQQRVSSQLANEAFVAKAPPAVVEKLRARRDEIQGQLEALRRQLASWS
ncbi:MAG: class I tRNA ligase family protein, partial [Candidatus Sericytochromatia bacterium]|nr:class I tRNA ligase family protein [Candidatus Sericytochromatia bacterium]